MLELKNISVSYGQIDAIRNVNLKIEKGEIVTLIGSNGAGKTTILRTISALIRAKSGSVFFEGQDISNEKPHIIVRKGLVHVPERRGIFANLTVDENLLLGGFNRKLTASDYEHAAYNRFPILRERRTQLAGTLSGGEQQMLAMSRALLSSPKLLLLDEPSLGLAPQIVKSIFETIKEINAQGTTVLLVEQNAAAALKIGHRGYVLEVGEIIYSDKCENLLHNDVVKRAYLGH